MKPKDEIKILPTLEECNHTNKEEFRLDAFNKITFCKECLHLYWHTDFNATQVFKLIGFTTTTVFDRVKQINSATGVITPWYPVFSYKCPNGRMLEQDIHSYLEDIGTRVSPNREGFVIDTDKAREIIERLGEKYKTN